MDGTKVIKQLLIERDKNITDLADGLKINAQSARNKLNRNNYTLKEFEKCLSLLNAHIVVIADDTGKEFY